jgi:lipopolysaccharide transport system permease protein
MAVYLLQYHELIKNLVISDLKVKYASSALGFAWSLLNPLAMMVILYFVFSNVFQGNEEHFVLYILIGILWWRFFSLGTASALRAIVSKPSLVTKVYIPRETLTLSSVISSLISSLLEFTVLLPMLFIIGPGVHASILLFPVILLLSFLLVYAISLFLSSLYVYFRDLNQVWDVVLQLGFFACPIVYPVSLVPQAYAGYYMLNPVTVLMGMYRDIFLHGMIPPAADFLLAGAFALALLASGMFTFSRLSRRFAEEV